MRALSHTRTWWLGHSLGGRGRTFVSFRLRKAYSLSFPTFSASALITKQLFKRWASSPATLSRGLYMLEPKAPETYKYAALTQALRSTYPCALCFLPSIVHGLAYRQCKLINPPHVGIPGTYPIYLGHPLGQSIYEAELVLALN